MCKQRGLSLIELMLSLCLSSFMLLILFHYYLVCKEQYRRLEQDLEQFTDKQWIAALLQDSIRRAGFTPCVGTDHLIKTDTRPLKGGLDSISLAEMGIHLRRMNNPEALLQIINSKQIIVAKSPFFSLYQPILIADCFHGEIHDLQSIHQTQHRLLLELKKPIQGDFSASTFVGEWLDEFFYLQKEPALRFNYQRNHTETLSKSIHHMSASITHTFPRVVRIVLDASEPTCLDFYTRVRTP